LIKKHDCGEAQFTGSGAISTEHSCHATRIGMTVSTRPRRSVYAGIAGLILVAVGALTACSPQQPRTEVNWTVIDFLADAYEGNEETYELADATDWEWDEVSVFDVNTLAETVYDVTGYEIGDMVVQQSTLLVFELDGEIVRAVNVLEKTVKGTVSEPTVDYPGLVTTRNTMDGGLWFVDSQ
jgi:hypothetical protein